MVTVTYGFTSSVTKINVQTYNLLINDDTLWYCLTCSKKLYPLSALNDNDFHSTIQGKTIKFKAFTRKRSSLENVLIDKLNDAVNESDLEHLTQVTIGEPIFFICTYLLFHITLINPIIF